MFLTQIGLVSIFSFAIIGLVIYFIVKGTESNDDKKDGKKKDKDDIDRFL